MGMNHRNRPGVHFQRMTDEQCQRIHEASLEVMERTGVRLYEQEAIDLLQNAGAQVSDGNRVRIRPKLVEEAFTDAPCSSSARGVVMPIPFREAA